MVSLYEKSLEVDSALVIDMQYKDYGNPKLMMKYPDSLPTALICDIQEAHITMFAPYDLILSMKIIKFCNYINVNLIL